MSLAETQQIMRDLQEIMQLLNGITTKSEKVVADAPKIKDAELSLRQQVRTIDIMLMTLSAATGDKTIDGATRKIQQFIMLLMRARMLMLALGMAMNPASGFGGLAYFGANMLSIGMTVNTLGQ